MTFNCPVTKTKPILKRAKYQIATRRMITLYLNYIRFIFHTSKDTFIIFTVEITANNIFVFTKSQYRFKINYYIDLVKSLFSKPNKIDKKFEEEIQVFLLSKNFIIEPYSFSVQIQKQETFQFIGEIDENDFD